MKQVEQTRNAKLSNREIGSASNKRDSLDMTPMVDVTFLLLIFFMVTASFVVQKSIEHPSSLVDQAAETQTPKMADPIQIAINQDNTYFVTTPEMKDYEAPSDSELRSQISSAVAEFHASEMTIVAHVDSLHSKLVTAWDAGAVNGIARLQIETTTEDF
jgi:biopolymer transport protein ExbD